MPRQLAGNWLTVYLLAAIASAAVVVYALVRSVDTVAGEGIEPPAHSGEPRWIEDWLKEWQKPDPAKMNAAIDLYQKLRAEGRGGQYDFLTYLKETPTDLHRDAIWLRENPDPDFLPVLIRFLRADRGTGSIDQYAAAQALFALGSPEGLDAIAEAVGETPCGYQVLYAFMYAPHWCMDPVQASEMHKRFHLSHLSKVFDLSVAASKEPGNVILAVTVTNFSDREQDISWLSARAGLIVVEDMKDGRLLVPMREMGRVCDLRSFLEKEMLPPGTNKEFRWRLSILSKKDNGWGWVPDGHIVLNTDVSDRPVVDLGEGGEFRFWVVWETPALWDDYPEADREGIEPDRRWAAARLFERSVAVSNPVTIRR